MPSDQVPVHYEFEEEVAAEAAAQLRTAGLKADVEKRRGSFAVVVPADQSDEALAKLGPSHQPDAGREWDWQTIRRKAVTTVVVFVSLILLLRTVWGTAAVWVILVVGGIASAAFYSRDDVDPNRLRD